MKWVLSKNGAASSRQVRYAMAVQNWVKWEVCREWQVRRGESQEQATAYMYVKQERNDRHEYPNRQGKKQTRIEIKLWVKCDKHELINEHKERESRNYLTSMKALKIWQAWTNSEHEECVHSNKMMSRNQINQMRQSMNRVNQLNSIRAW